MLSGTRLTRLSHLPESPTIGLQLNLRRLKSRIFVKHGRRPYARGYGSYRQVQLQEHLYKRLRVSVVPVPSAARTRQAARCRFRAQL